MRNASPGWHCWILVGGNGPLNTNLGDECALFEEGLELNFIGSVESGTNSPAMISDDKWESVHGRCSCSLLSTLARDTPIGKE